MIGNVLASVVLGLSLVSACASDTPATGRPAGSGRFPTQPQPPSPGGPAGTPAATPSFPGTLTDNPQGILPLAGTISLPQAGNGAPAADTCASADIPTQRYQPVVWLVVDGSGSMADSLVKQPAQMTTMMPPPPTVSRWDALRLALMDANGGVVPALEKLVKFGMVMYDGPLGRPSMDMPTPNECPRLVTAEPALNNFATLDPLLPLVPPGGSTPTHNAMAQVLSHLPSSTTLPDGTVQPTYVVLATDGAPNDFCGGGMEGDPPATDQVVTLTTSIAAQGIPVYVISLAADDQRLSTHLAAVAQAGGTQQPPFTPQTKEQLVKTFLDIIGPEVGCTVQLMSGFGVMAQAACRGKVTLNGVDLDCGSDNGWKLVDPKTIEITGTACEEYKKQSNARLTAYFPCEIQNPG